MSGRVQWLRHGQIRPQRHIPLPCARRMGPVTGTRLELHWLRLPRCLCAVFTMTMYPFHPKAVTLLRAVPTPCVRRIGPVIGIQRELH